MTEEQIRQALDGKFFRGPSSFRQSYDGSIDQPFSSREDYKEALECVEVEAPAEVGDCFEENQTHRIPLAMIAKAVASVHGVNMEDLRVNPGAKGTRRKELTDARQHFAWVVKALRPDVSLTQIAFRLNYSDHTTALYGCRKFEATKAAHKERIAACYANIESEVGRGVLCV